MAQNQTLTIAALIFLVGLAGLVSGEAAADAETTDAQDNQDSSDYTDEDERYNCLTREVWSEEKQAWCDENFIPDQFEPEVVVCVLPAVEEKTNLEKAGDFIGSIFTAIGNAISDLFDFDESNVEEVEENEELPLPEPLPEDYDSYNIYRSTNQTN